MPVGPPGWCSVAPSWFKVSYSVRHPHATYPYVGRSQAYASTAFPLTFGVFQDYFGRHQNLANSTESIWIGVLSTGVPFMGAPFMTILCDTYPRIKPRYYVLFGWLLCASALIGAAFSRSLVALAWTQGVLYGGGLLILDVPVLLILNTWFIKRRGTAYGLLFGAADAIGFGATILAEWLLRNHTLQGALLTFACGITIISGPAIYLLKSRPADATTSIVVSESKEAAPTPSDHSTSPPPPLPITSRYYTRPIFYIFTLANTFHSTAWYLPFMYLPSYATSLGYSPTRGAYLLAAANFAQIFGELSFGHLSDRVNVHCLILASTLASSIAVFTLLGMAHSLVMLSFFALIFGTFGSGLISLWARMGTFFGQNDAQMIYSVMSFGRGLGSIVSGPISSALLRAAEGRRSYTHDNQSGDRAANYGNGKYIYIVLFVGTSMGVSALMGIVGLVVGWRQKELGAVDRKRSVDREREKASQDEEI